MFDEDFEVFVADTDDSRRLHHRIRYVVYCLETGYEDPESYPDGEERDEWDPQSVHFLVRHRRRGDWVAAMRLILPCQVLPPMAQFCRFETEALRSIDLSAAAEISRLSIVAQYRRRASDQIYPYEISGSALRERRCRVIETAVEGQRREERRDGPVILMGLIRAAVAVSTERSIRQWLFLINPALARVLKHLKVNLQRVGPALDHRGTRIPYLSDVGRLQQLGRDRDGPIGMLMAKGRAYRLFSEAFECAPLRSDEDKDATGSDPN